MAKGACQPQMATDRRGGSTGAVQGTHRKCATQRANRAEKSTCGVVVHNVPTGITAWGCLAAVQGYGDRLQVTQHGVGMGVCPLQEYNFWFF